MVGRWADLRLASPLVWSHTPPSDRSVGTAGFKEVPADGVIFGCLVNQVGVNIATRVGETYAFVRVSRKRDALAENVLGILYSDYLSLGTAIAQVLLLPVKKNTFLTLQALNSVSGVRVTSNVSWMRFD